MDISLSKLPWYGQIGAFVVVCGMALYGFHTYYVKEAEADLALRRQHLATLRAVIALIEAGVPELIAIPTDVAALPAGAGSASFPEPFEQPQLASPPEEGALQ